MGNTQPGRDGPIVGAFLDRTQTANAGLLVVFKRVLRNLNPKTYGVRRKKAPVGNEGGNGKSSSKLGGKKGSGGVVQCVVFNPNTALGAVLVCGMASGNVARP